MCVYTMLVECLWKREIVCDVKFLFFFAADICTYSHILGYFYLLICFCSFGHLLAMTRVCLETINILCLFWWFSLSNISMGWNVVSLCEFQKTLILWMFCNISVQYDFVQFCIWFCAIFCIWFLFLGIFFSSL